MDIIEAVAQYAQEAGKENGVCVVFLGTWQRIILVELDGPRRRTVHLSCV